MLYPKLNLNASPVQFISDSDQQIDLNEIPIFKFRAENGSL